MFVITGGGSGIGRALAHALATRGNDVFIIGRREEPLAETAAFSAHITYLCADVSTHEGREQVVKHVTKQQKMTGLIHNAGIIEPILPLTALDEKAWRQVMSTNLEAPLFLTQLLKEKLADSRVLHIGSAAAYFPVTGWSAYCVSKAGLSMLTRCWQLECREMAIASVMPGIIDTHMQAQIREASCMDPEKRNFFKQLKREAQLLSPATVALFLSWLLLDTDKARYVSQEWDIYDQTHHHEWLIPPHTVPTWE